ncbi:MAG: T9SS type B sorting domain-containing protein [Vicingaceae bacterium]
MRYLKFLSFLLLLSSMLFTASTGTAQCPNNNTFLTNLSPLFTGDTARVSCATAGSYVTTNVVLGNSYLFSTCGQNAFDTEITLRNNTGTVWYAFNDDFCSQQSQITWTATFTGTVRLLLDKSPSCTHDTICQELYVTQICQATTGSRTITKNGAPSTSPFYLCEGQDTVEVVSNNNFQLPRAAIGEVAELMYMICDCPLTSDYPTNDTCFNQFITTQDFTMTNPGIMNTGDHFYVYPVTVDDGDDGSNPNNQINIDQNGDSCFSVGSPMEFFLMNPIAFASNLNCLNKSVDITVFGGRSELNSSVYSVSNTGSGNVTGLPVSHGGNFSIENLKKGDFFSLIVTDVNGCSSDFSGGPSNIPNAGQDTVVRKCVNDPNFNLAAYRSGNYDIVGTWLGPYDSVRNSIFNPFTSPAGMWKYVVSGGVVCDNDTSYFDIRIDSFYEAGTDSFMYACQYDSGIDLSPLLSSNASDSGLWLNTANNVFSGVTGAINNYSPVKRFKYVTNRGSSCPEDTALHNILLSKFPYPGTDSSMSFCEIDSTFDLFSLLGGSPESGGYWLNPQGSSHNGFIDPGSDSAGSYQYIVGNRFPCADTSASILVSIANLADPGVGNTTVICKSDSMTNLILQLNGNPDNNGVWIDPNADTIASGMVNPAIALNGTYFYHLAQNQPCPDTFSTLNLGFIEPPDPGMNDSSVYCTSDAGISLSNLLSPTVDTGGSWYDPLNNLSSGTFDPGIDPGGIYEYRVTGQSPCSDSSSYHYLQKNNAVNPGRDTTIRFCSSDLPVDLVQFIPGFPDSGGIWQDPFNNPFSMPFTPGVHIQGIYKYLVSAAAPCEDSSSKINVVVVNKPNPGLNASINVCSKDSAFNLRSALGGSPAAGGIWKDSVGNTVSGTFYPSLQNGNVFTYTIMANSPCKDSSAQLIVNHGQEPNPGISSVLSLCSNDSAVGLTSSLGGNPDTFGTWKTPQGNTHSGFFNPVTDPTGTYIYTVPGAGSCNDSSSTVTLSVVQAPNPGGDSSATFCAIAGPTSMTSLLTSNPDTTGYWRNPTNVVVSSLYNPTTQSPGIYRYTVLGSGPCADSSSYLTIYESPAPNPGISSIISRCESDSSFSLRSVLGGNPDSNGTWKSSSGAGMNGSFNPQSDTSDTFFYTVTGILPCADSTTSVSVNVVSNVNAGMDTSITFCDNMTPSNLFLLLAGNPDQGGIWKKGGAPISSAIFNPAVDSAGSFIYTVTATAPCLDKTATVNINVNELYSPGEDASLVICETGSPFNFFNVLNGNPDIYGFWLDPKDDVFDGLSSSIELISGVYTYVIPENAPCPSDSSEIDLLINKPPNAGTGTSFGICESGMPVKLFDYLEGGAENTGWWLNPDGNLFGGVYNPSSDKGGIYKYVVSGEIPCPDDTSYLRVEVAQQPNAGSDTSLIVCWNYEKVRLSDYLDSTGFMGGSWFYYDFSPLNGYFEPMTDGAGDYFYVLPGTAYCPGDTMKALVLLTSPFSVNAGPDLYLSYGEQRRLDATSFKAQKYLWIPDHGLSNNKIATPVFSAKESTQYIVKAYDQYGCTASDTLNVSVLANLFAPNTFTPNADGVNDYWFVNGLSEYPGATFYILNREGQQLFRSSSPDDRWDGTFQGKIVPSGNYWFYVEFEDNTRFSDFKGVLNVLR